MKGKKLDGVRVGEGMVFENMDGEFLLLLVLLLLLLLPSLLVLLLLLSSVEVLSSLLLFLFLLLLLLVLLGRKGRGDEKGKGKREGFVKDGDKDDILVVVEEEEALA